MWEEAPTIANQPVLKVLGPSISILKILTWKKCTNIFGRIENRFSSRVDEAMEFPQTQEWFLWNRYMPTYQETYMNRVSKDAECL